MKTEGNFYHETESNNLVDFKPKRPVINRLKRSIHANSKQFTFNILGLRILCRGGEFDSWTQEQCFTHVRGIESKLYYHFNDLVHARLNQSPTNLTSQILSEFCFNILPQRAKEILHRGFPMRGQSKTVFAFVK